ncbi:MAG: hypothetical protein U1C50_00050, partial [Patescibacteria group bacterium]|nr:hypothetical protein [Patescibacteria group bacterium]
MTLLYIFSWLLLVIYSFTRQDLNLTWYHQLTTPLQTLGWYQRPLATLVFVTLSLLFFLIYLYLIRKHSTPGWNVLILLAVSGIFAYPMFSYDLFNYIFNAKMVWIYQVNPHLRTAIEFSADPMLRFMQNVHTPAPYAYGWTLASLLPGLSWFFGKFTLAFWSMKAFVAAFWLGQLWILQKLVRRLFPKQPWRFWLFALNPLVLVETLINGHNDVMMMFLALLSYWFFLNHNKVKAILFLLLSATIKYATIVLLPLYFLPRRLFPAAASLLLLAVMFTRPDQLHSWYLIWAFSLAVLAKPKWLVSVFTALT